LGFNLYIKNLICPKKFCEKYGGGEPFFQKKGGKNFWAPNWGESQKILGGAFKRGASEKKFSPPRQKILKNPGSPLFGGCWPHLKRGHPPGGPKWPPPPKKKRRGGGNPPRKKPPPPAGGGGGPFILLHPQNSS